jgi:hypothetical protein
MWGVDKELMREGSIADLVAMIDEFSSSVKGDFNFDIIGTEYGKNWKVKHDKCFEKLFWDANDFSEALTFLFDLDIHGWSVQIAGLSHESHLKTFVIALERFTD